MNNKENTYIVSLDEFEGPLDLLHQLIEKRKLQINTISLAKVTADYITYIRNVVTTPIEEVSRFVNVASTLILIKSKSLLPILEYTKEEEGDVSVLETRIKLFNYIRTEAVVGLTDWLKRAIIVQAPKEKKEISFTPDVSCTPHGIYRNACAVTNELRHFKTLPNKKVAKVIEIEEIIEKVLQSVTDRITVSFKELSQKVDKQETVVSFLAILELIRKDLLVAKQSNQFDDIVITKR